MSKQPPNDTRVELTVAGYSFLVLSSIAVMLAYFKPFLFLYAIVYFAGMLWMFIERNKTDV